jgi:hypothetical protein
MPSDLPPDLSIDDAIALILNIDYLPGSNGVLEMFSYFKEEVESKHDHAKTPDERRKYAGHILMHQFREGLARAIFDAIDAEISAIRNGGISELELVDNTFGNERLVTASVCEWASQRGFGIYGWKLPRFWRKASIRSFSTEYLDILDDVIATFCEEGGEYYEPGVTPKKEVISNWITGKYGAISDKVIDVIGTMIRPGLTITTKQPKKK